jgi:hypothetical protein
MSKWKPIDKNETVNDFLVVHKSFTLDNSSYGQNFIQFKSGSSSDFTTNDSGSYWDSNRVNFYLSGSSLEFNSDSSSYDAGKKFNNLYFTLFPENPVNPPYVNKFHSTGSTLSVSQYYFGDGIQRKTFKLTDNSHPSGTVIIVDDGYGNLYAPSASVSSSGETSISSSDNYVGNISYTTGVINITETGSFSSDISYKSVGTGLDGGIGSGSYTFEFNSTHIIHSKEYSLKIGKRDFNFTTNPSARRFSTNPSHSAYNSKLSSPHLTDSILGFINKMMMELWMIDQLWLLNIHNQL